MVGFGSSNLKRRKTEQTTTNVGRPGEEGEEELPKEEQQPKEEGIPRDNN